MKKAKIYLTALTMLAVIGGALAFKAKVSKIFATCNTMVEKCIMDPFTTFQTTTQAGGFKVTYNEYNAPCVYDQLENKWTCTTRVTIAP